MYSKKQIEAIVKHVAQYDLSELDISVAFINANGGAITGELAVTGDVEIGGDLDVNGGFNANTISSTNFNYEQTILTTETATLPEGLEWLNLYYKLVVDDKMMYLVISGGVRNTTDATISFNIQTALTNNEVVLPTALADKIYSQYGKKVTETTAPYLNVICPIYVKVATSGSLNVGGSIAHHGVNTISISPQGSANVSAGSQIGFDARVFIIL